jgi:hypothetical protein
VRRLPPVLLVLAALPGAALAQLPADDPIPPITLPTDTGTTGTTDTTPATDTTPPPATDTQPPAETTAETQPPATTAATAPPPPSVRRSPVLEFTIATRADARGRDTLLLQPTGKAAAGMATLRLVKGNRKLASGLLATSGTKPLKLRLTLKRKDRRLLSRKHALKVRLSISLTDIDGHSAHAAKSFTLRSGS